jgi:RimJ/RimL family protein N-acetyltransferase
VIRTHRLRLVPATIAHFEAMQRGDAELGRLLQAEPAPGWEGAPEHRPAIAEGGAAFLRDNPTAAGWWTYFFVHVWDVRLIGVGGLKGPPADGVAEIGYALAPGYRGQGLALEAATALRDFAFADRRVQRVIAHTLPEENESNRLLEKLGMRFDGVSSDPDEGDVWRWAVERPG